jgi:hypothetical protein
VIAPKPKQVAEAVVEIRIVAARIAKRYPEAHADVYGLRRRNNGQAKVKTSASDPTAGNHAASGRGRSLLRRADKRLQSALRALEDAEEAVSDVFTEPADVRAVQAGYLSLARRLR